MVQIVRYLKRAPDRKLLYSDCSHGGIANLLDTNWAGSPIDKRSTIGYCVFVKKKICIVKKQNARCDFEI